MAIEVNNESGLDIDVAAVQDIARYALSRMRIHPLSELSVIAVDEEAMERCTSSGWTCPGPPT